MRAAPSLAKHQQIERQRLFSMVGWWDTKVAPAPAGTDARWPGLRGNHRSFAPPQIKSGR